jgi:hypothetical protein
LPAAHRGYTTFKAGLFPVARLFQRDISLYLLNTEKRLIFSHRFLFFLFNDQMPEGMNLPFAGRMICFLGLREARPGG